MKTTHKIDKPCRYTCNLNIFLTNKSDLHNANDHFKINGVR